MPSTRLIWRFRRPRQIEDLKRLRLEDGDTLVLRLAEPLTMDAYDHVMRSLKGRFPNNEVLILERDTTLAVMGKGRK